MKLLKIAAIVSSLTLGAMPSFAETMGGIVEMISSGKPDASYKILVNVAGSRTCWIDPDNKMFNSMLAILLSAKASRGFVWLTTVDHGGCEVVNVEMK